MSKTFRKFYFTSLLFLFSFPFLSQADDIQIPDPKIYQAHKETLKAIVYISAKEACSATRVGKRILLTARHCTKFKPDVKGKIALNVNNMPYSVLKVISQTEKANEEISTADVALLLLDKDLPPEIPILKIADRTTQLTGSGYIAAGFGTIDKNLEAQYEKINDQYFAAAEGDWSFYAGPVPSVQLKSIDATVLSSMKTRYPETHVAIIKLNCNTTDYYQNAYSLMGEYPLDRKRNCTLQENFKGAQITGGDSGGPAIMFDQNKKPVIVGVASRAISEKNYVDQSNYKLSVYGLARLPQKTDTMAPEKTLIETHSFSFNYSSGYTMTPDTDLNMKKLDKALAVLAGEVFNFKLFKVLAVEKITQDYGISVYASVLSEKNFMFLQNGLKELSKP